MGGAKEGPGGCGQAMRLALAALVLAGTDSIPLEHVLSDFRYSCQ